jgi:GT2 family glycosyltransferase
MKGKIAILVVSYNYPELTDSLCEAIVSRTKGVDYDLYVLENGSSREKLSSHMTIWIREGIRMTRGFNLLKKHADLTALGKGYEYDAYHLFVNDAKFIDEKDLTSVLYEEMMQYEDCGEINPYQVNMAPPHIRQNKMNPSGARKESFSEIICPLIRAKAWNTIPDLLDDRFFFGWGLDYDMPTVLHKNGWRLYISDTVGIFHQAFTSYREKEKTQEKLNLHEFVDKARNNMNEGLEKKYGKEWRKIIHDSVPADVNRESLYLWLHINDGFNL